MSDSNIIKKEYRPKNIKSPLLGFAFIFLIYVGFRMIFTGYSQLSFQKYIAISTLMFSGICVSIYLLYATFVHCLYIETTAGEISGKNILKIKRGSLKFQEINNIRITERIRVIFLKDIKGKKLTIFFHPEFIPLLKEILEKADNLEKIDINYDYFIKINAFSEISQIKPVLDRRLAEIRNKIKSV